MELFATSCVWNGDSLTIYEPSQYVYGLKNGVAAQLGIDADRSGDQFLCRWRLRFERLDDAAHGDHRQYRPAVGPPGQAGPTRDQGFTIATYRAETRHQIQLGAGRDGKLTALRHEGWEISSRPDAYAVGGTKTTTRLYACPNVESLVSIVRADRNTPGFMRSPPEVPYMFALESAMDELAFSWMDPVELRRINDTIQGADRRQPYTSRSLMACYDEARRRSDGRNRKRAEIDVGGRLADRIWLRHHLLSDADGAGGGARSPAARRPHPRRDRRSRDRQWRLHRDRAGRRRKARRARRKGLGVHRRQRSAAGAGGRRLQFDGEYMFRRDDGMRADQAAPVQGTDAEESLVDKAKETVGMGQTPSTRRRRATSPLDLERPSTRSASAWSRSTASGSRTGAPMDSFRAMHNGQVRMVGGEDEGQDRLRVRRRICRGPHQPMDP
jgi:xanthine dehydrogenase YagR molybdenum-binding subunit